MRRATKCAAPSTHSLRCVEFRWVFESGSRDWCLWLCDFEESVFRRFHRATSPPSFLNLKPSSGEFKESAFDICKSRTRRKSKYLSLGRRCTVTAADAKAYNERALKGRRRHLRINRTFCRSHRLCVDFSSVCYHETGTLKASSAFVSIDRSPNPAKAGNSHTECQRPGPHTKTHTKRIRKRRRSWYSARASSPTP